MGLLDSLNPINLVKSTAESVIDAVLPDNLKALGSDIADAALDMVDGNYGGLLGDVADCFKDADQAMSALATTDDSLLSGVSAQPDSPPAAPAPQTSAAPVSTGPASETVSGIGHVDGMIASPTSTSTSNSTDDAAAPTPSAAAAAPIADVTASSATATPTIADASAGTSATAAVSSSTAAAATSKATSTSSEASTTNKADQKDITTFFAQSDADLMASVRDGKLPDAVKNDPASMQRLQLRMNEISEMNQLISQMMAAMHDMHKAVIQNIRA